MSFEKFLKSVAEKFPEEVNLMFGPVDASPESGSAKVHPDSYAHILLPDYPLVDTREFDRASLGLKAYYDIMEGDTRNWSISQDLIEKISCWVKNMEGGDSYHYAILFNDLGKLHISNEQHQLLYGEYCADHDMNMVDILKKTPGFYPNFSMLPQKYQNSLIKGLSSGFNLGKAVQMECPVAAWKPFMELSDFDKDFHLVHSFFDFLGVSGAANPRDYSPFIMNDDNIKGFMGLIENKNYELYAKERLRQVGIVSLGEIGGRNFALARLIGMARIFKNASPMMVALDALEEKEYLYRELNYPGSLCLPAIELQYSPAILSLANTDQEILTALEFFVGVMKKVRSEINDYHSDIFIVNLVEIASILKNNYHFPENYRLEPMQGGARLKLSND